MEQRKLLSLSKNGKKPCRLVLNSFDSNKPYVVFIRSDKTRVLVNVEGVRRLAHPKLDDPDLLAACNTFGVPSGISSEFLEFTKEPIKIETILYKSRAYYKHVLLSGDFVWLVTEPKNGYIAPEKLEQLVTKNNKKEVCQCA